jgi:fumarate hydratase subunit beta
MSEIRKLQAPLTQADVRSLKAGDEVLVSGVVYTARDMAHKRLCETIKAGWELPFELAGAIIYFVGPTPAAPGRIVGAAGPTTSSRMDLGGAGALLSEHITASEVIAYEDLETEAIRKLQVIDFPAVVAYDCYGNSVYKQESAIR